MENVLTSLAKNSSTTHPDDLKFDGEAKHVSLHGTKNLDQFLLIHITITLTMLSNILIDQGFTVFIV